MTRKSAMSDLDNMTHSEGDDCYTPARSGHLELDDWRKRAEEAEEKLVRVEAVSYRLRENGEDGWADKLDAALSEEAL